MDLPKTARAAAAQGWRVERTARGHWQFWPPDKTEGPCVGSGTPGDVRAIRNLLACLKRKGFHWP
jgi:hypothetical protein